MTAGSHPMPILDIGYVNHGFPRLGIEAKPIADIIDPAQPAFFGRPHRLAFHHVMLVTSGQGTHRVDFEDYVCEPGTVIHVRPGQVHQYRLDRRFEAHSVLFAADFLPPMPECRYATGASAGSNSAATAMRLDGSALERVRRTFSSINEEYRHTAGCDVSGAILQHQLQVLLLQLRKPSRPVFASSERGRQHRTHARFLDMVERFFATTRRVQDYADDLGCSAKTLHRACVTVAGLSPKEIIERRVTVEAARLLAHTAISTGELAARLGFSEPTNFVKFFRRREGMTPTAFRDGFSWQPSLPPDRRA
jgi:AraC-like DNA-binding protein